MQCVYPSDDKNWIYFLDENIELCYEILSFFFVSPKNIIFFVIGNIVIASAKRKKVFNSSLTYFIISKGKERRREERRLKKLERHENETFSQSFEKLSLFSARSFMILGSNLKI